uniref:Uncharacterized protein n=1 Tax=Tanacetum cinerariifolium TaxID=118510 RepID=A0A6L2JRQ4_TANCI|nr:hypothetical protein [Tanacetum cinerariifolium]
MEKGLMRRSDIPTPKKKNDVMPRRSRKITADDNLLKDPDEALEYAKMVKLKAKEQPLLDAHLLLNLRHQNKESKKQAIVEEIKRKAQGEGSGAAPESPKHSSSFDDSSNDDKTDSKRESELEETKSDSENGEEGDKFNNDAKSTKSENDEPDNDSDD